MVSILSFGHVAKAMQSTNVQCVAWLTLLMSWLTWRIRYYLQVLFMGFLPWHT